MQADARFSHEVYEQIKIPVVLDGDLAATICNAFGFLAENGDIPEVLMCGHVEPKLIKLLNKLQRELDIEHREEK